MADVKYRPLEPLSGWMEYPLLTNLLDPPIFRCRLRPIDFYNLMDGLGGGEIKLGKATMETAIEAIAEWDLTSNGIPIPPTLENKIAWIRPIIAEQVADRDPGILLGIAIVMDAQKRENFLKN